MHARATEPTLECDVGQISYLAWNHQYDAIHEAPVGVVQGLRRTTDLLKTIRVREKGGKDLEIA